MSPLVFVFLMVILWPELARDLRKLELWLEKQSKN